MLFEVFGVICVVDKAYIDRDGQLRFRRVTIGRHCLVILVVARNFTVNLQIRILVRFQQLQTGLSDEDIFQVFIELGSQRSIHILRLNREISNRNGLHLIVIDRGAIKLIGHTTGDDDCR